MPIDDSFLDEQLLLVAATQVPWYANFVNYIEYGILPPEFTYQQKKKFLSDVKHYFWDEPHLFKLGVDGIHRRCIPEGEADQIIQHCHSSPYGGHARANKTAAKILQSGFFWPTLFKDVACFVKSCDRCQRMGNLTRKYEMPLKNILLVDLFDVMGNRFHGSISHPRVATSTF